MYLETIGKYALMLKEVFKRPQKPKIFWENYFKEVEDLGIKSIGLVSFISFFIGGVVTIQTARNLNNPLIDKMYIGYATIKSIILEFSPTFISIILAGIVGSYIASTIGTMRITEQIDALDVMGVNSLNYLVLPKLVAAVTFYPFLITISMFLTLANSFKLFDQNLSLTNGGPGGATEMLALNIYKTAYTFTNYGEAQAKAVVFFLLVAAITMVQVYTNKKKEVEM